MFDRFVFKPVNEEDLYLSHVNGMADVRLHDFTPLSISCAAKPEYKHELFQKEYIDSFLNAAKVITDFVDQTKPKQPVSAIFRTYSLALSVLYLCRHCMELSLKRAIEHLGGDVCGDGKNIGHCLSKLWDDFLTRYSEHVSDNSGDQTLSDMKKFLDIVCKFDETGTKLRYSEDHKVYTQPDFYWVNLQRFVSCTSQFVEQLGSLHISNVDDKNRLID